MTALATQIVNRPTTYAVDCQIGNVYTPNRQIRFHLNPTTRSLTISVHDIQNNAVNPAPICQLTPEKVTYEEWDSKAKVMSSLSFEQQCAILCRITEKNISDAIASTTPHSKAITSIALLV